MNRRVFRAVALIAALAVPSVVPAQSGGQPMQHGDMKPAAGMADGEIRKALDIQVDLFNSVRVAYMHVGQTIAMHELDIAISEPCPSK